MRPKSTMSIKRLVPLFLLLPLLPACIIAQGGFDQELFLKPGDQINLKLGLAGCCYFIIPVPGPALWSVTPTTEGVTINPLSGLLTIAPTVPDGTQFSVYAGPRKILVTVYEPVLNPLYNSWKELEQITCDTEEPYVPAFNIDQIIFKPSGEFTVTWRPFEVYIDYRGAYTYDRETGELEMVINRSSANYIPDDFDGVGTATVEENGDIVLRDLWLGSPRRYDDTIPVPPVNCGHRITPYP
mgnify:CR=1 FL=1